MTGAGRGIGREEALRLAREGAAVVVNDLGGDFHGEGADQRPAQLVVDEIVAAGGRASANYDDVSSWTGAQALIDQAVAEHGDLHVLVNNAGILRDAMSFTMTEAAWDAVINVHLKGHFAPSHFAAAYWRSRSKAGRPTSGRIINTTSDSGLFGNPGQANYAAAKAGIASMTLVLARELSRYGVTVNAITPRARTRLTEGIGFGEAPAEGFDRLAPEHVAPVVAWLATDGAADVNGQIFIINATEIMVLGGYHVEGAVDGGERPWTLAGLAEAKGALFAKRGSGTPELAPPGW
ncbi:SDR family NAD(P)-dependent oxidoreductase [Dactylosporangium sp. CA-092794]|uniref:SDR family NAD(P)-dependent oxidoreductase n=1 Tax=Dactylosporangium sp. CA-092794 TaxID=3239929 RepID=UPI003D8E8D67